MVKAGQVLFTLDKREYEAQLMQAQAQLASAEADLRAGSGEVRRRSLRRPTCRSHGTAEQDRSGCQAVKACSLKQKAVPQQDYDDALAAQQAARAEVEGRQAALSTSKVNQSAAILTGEAAVEAANANIRQAKLNVEYCTVTSPITGIAGIRQVAPGNLVGQGEATLLDHRLQRESDARLHEHQRTRVPEVSAHAVEGKMKGARRHSN